MRSPAFQFYPADWLSSETVAAATLEEEGVYIRLLCYAWREGSIPVDSNRCAALVGKGASEDVVRVVQGWFNQSPTDSARLVHERLEKEREKQRAWSEKSAEGGKKSAEKRASKRVGKGGSTTLQPPHQPNGNSSSSSSSSELPPKPPASASPPLDVKPTSEEAKAIADIFGRRHSTAWGDKEIRAFKGLMKRGVMTMDNMALISPYYTHERAKNGTGIHRRDLKTFLNNFDTELDRARAFAANPKAHDKPNGTNPTTSTRNAGTLNDGRDHGELPERLTGRDKTPYWAEGQET